MCATDNPEVKKNYKMNGYREQYRLKQYRGNENLLIRHKNKLQEISRFKSYKNPSVSVSFIMGKTLGNIKM